MFTQFYRDQYGRGKIVEGIESFKSEISEGVKRMKIIGRSETFSFYTGYRNL